MKYCFFIIKKRAAYFNIEKILKGSNTRFILIAPEGNLIDADFKKNMHSCHIVKDFNLEECIKLIKKETKCNNLKDKAVIVCTDEALLMTAAKIREYFNIKGARPYQYVSFKNKRIMKQILTSSGIKTPKFIDFDGVNTINNLKDYHEYINSILDGALYLVKPLASGSSIGVAIIKNYLDLKKWYLKYFDPNDEYGIDEFIPGEMYHCDSFSLNGKIKFVSVYKYLYPNLDFLSGKPLGSAPLNKASKLYKNIIEFNRKTLKALRPPNGATHLELMINKKNDITFIEIGSRPPGASIVGSIEKNYGINLYELTLRNELGLELNFKPKENLYHGWVYLSTYPGTVRSLNVPKLRSKMDITWLIKPKDKIKKSPSSVMDGISAKLDIYNPKYNDLLKDCELLKEHKPYR